MYRPGPCARFILGKPAPTTRLAPLGCCVPSSCACAKLSTRSSSQAGSSAEQYCCSSSCSSSRWVRGCTCCIGLARSSLSNASSNGSTSVKPTTLKPATALKEHTCASTRISGDAVILVVNVFQLTTWSLPHSAKGRVVLALADVSFFGQGYGLLV